MDEFVVPDDISSLFDSQVQKFEFTAEEAHMYATHLAALVTATNEFVNKMRDHIVKVSPSKPGSPVKVLIGLAEYEVAITAINSTPVVVWHVAVARNCPAAVIEDED